MTEYDSGSSSDASSSDSGSSSGGSSDYGGIDYSSIAGSLIGHLIEDLTEPRRQDRPDPGPSEAELRRRAQFEATLKSFFVSSAPSVDQRSLVRRIVEAERWFVPIEPDGSFARLGDLDERTLRAFARPLSADAANRRRPQTKHALTSVVFALLTDPGRPARQLSGRELARAIPAHAGGVLLELDAETSFGLRREELPLLTQLADSLDLERLLVEPAPGQVAALQAARWYAPGSNEKLKPSPPGWGPPVVTIYTHPDRAEAKLHPLLELDGLTIAKRLANRGDFVEIRVNPSRPVYLGEQELNGVSLAPSFARGIARGVDPRPGAEPLPARTLAEVILWLDLDGFPWEDREIVAVPDAGDAVAGAVVADTTLIQVRARGTSDWHLVGKPYQQQSRPRSVLSPVFRLARPDQLPIALPAPVPPAFVTVYGGHFNPDAAALSAASIDLGDGPTRILCAGKVARKLYDQNHWAPDGWFISRLDRLRAARLAGWANELLKLIPPGKDRLPGSSLLTIEGTSFLRNRPEFRDRAWIERQHQRHTRSATRRFNFWR